MSALPFAKGINLSHWLQYTGRQPITAEDLATIARAGFDHVRVPFDPEQFGWRVDNGALGAPLPAAAATRLDRAVDMILAAGLSVIIDCHPEEELRDRIERNPAAGRALVALWAFLARRYADRPAERVAFEPLNEPQYYREPAASWNQLQAQLLRTIREAAPHNLVLLGAIKGSAIEGLEPLTVIPDPNVRYVFHFYEPMLFTHLNAPWEPFKSGPYGMIEGLEYPAERLSLSNLRLRPGADMGRVISAVRDYRDGGWNQVRITGRIAEAALWAKRNGAALQCTEFGVLALSSAVPAARMRWLADVRQALERFAIGWTLWDYADLFAISHPTEGVSPSAESPVLPRNPNQPGRVFDPAALMALGLQ